ncbi:MAG: hypothetical protein JXN61_05275 [Sedimentisphaerales bacterium]|nr:hypothetical protein [Sedimentisphaerales bacterium]
MNSKERIVAAIEGRQPDHTPLTTWCFGVAPSEHLRWERNGEPVIYWYSKRMEHIHTLAQEWTLQDDFRRVERWLELGIDDILDISIPWGRDPQVTSTDSVVPPGTIDSHPVLVREYRTPSGPLRHAIKQTQEDPGPGWVIQPEHVALFEDYNVPRGVEHAVSKPADVPAVEHLYVAPGQAEREWLAERTEEVRRFAEAQGVLVQAWSAFGMDAAVWLAGTEGAIMLAMDAPEAFARLLDIIAQTDYARTELAAQTPGIDMVVMRGWYSSTNFWSPRMFDEFLFDHIRALADLAHKHGKKFAYTITTGVETLGPRLADAGVDVLYFVDPVQDSITIEKARELLADRITLVGGSSALTLASGEPEHIHSEVHKALDILGSTNRFILHPVDALFPDTPWRSIEEMIEAWRRHL